MNTRTATPARKSTVTPAQRARIAQARQAVKDAVAAQREASANVRGLKSIANREAHAMRPTPVSASAVAHVTGKPLADGASVTVTVAPDATMGKYVSLRALAGKRVTFTREGDTYVAQIIRKGKGESGQALAQAVKREASATLAVKRARARVATLTGKGGKPAQSDAASA